MAGNIIEEGNNLFSRETPDPKALALLSAASAEKLSAVPVRFDEKGKLVVAMSDPDDIPAIEEIRMLTGYGIVAKKTCPEDIRRAVSDFYKVARNVNEAMLDHRQNDTGEGGGIRFSEEAEQLDVLSADDAPVVKLLNNILERSVAERASDVHIEPAEKETRVRFRIDGILFTVFTIPTELHNALIARIKIKARMDIAEKRRPQDGRILATNEKGKIDIRVSTIAAAHGEKAVMRLLDQSAADWDIASLGFSQKQREQIGLILRQRHGICLLTGPTGSGKSTTLYALLQQLKNTQVNIVTIEDPVEYSIAGVTQIQVNEKIGLSFGSLLRSVLRQDPDIIMVGEIRDTETAQLAVRAALTGHLVLATLHTNDAPSAVSRLLDMGVPAFLLASSLNCVIAQRLVRRLCPECKQKIPESEIPAGGGGLQSQYRAVGCPSCRGTGYLGRIAIAEIMPVDDAMRELIGGSVPVHRIRAYAEEKGMQRLFENAMEKMEAGLTDINEIYGIEII